MKFPIDFVLIPMREMNIVVGIDWLIQFADIIDCERHLVQVRPPSNRELFIQGRVCRGLAFYSVVRARRYINHGCTILLVYVADTRVKKKKTTSNVSPVLEFFDVFHKNFSRVPPKRQV